MEWRSPKPRGLYRRGTRKHNGLTKSTTQRNDRGCRRREGRVCVPCLCRFGGYTNSGRTPLLLFFPSQSFSRSLLKQAVVMITKRTYRKRYERRKQREGVQAITFDDQHRGVGQVSEHRSSQSRRYPWATLSASLSRQGADDWRASQLPAHPPSLVQGGAFGQPGVLNL